MGLVKDLPIDRLRTDGGLQLRARIDQEHVERLAEAFAAEDDSNALPPIQVYHDSADYWVWDGNHRILGAQRAGRDTIRCHIEKGTQRDAILKAAGANHDHGLPRSNADKRHAVATLLADKQWRKRSDRWIAETCRVSRPLVAEMRAVMEEEDRKEVERRAEQLLGAIKGRDPADEWTPDPETRVGRDGKKYHVAAPKEPHEDLLDDGHEAEYTADDPGQELPSADRVQWVKERLSWLWQQYRAVYGDRAEQMLFAMAWESLVIEKGWPS